MLPVMVPGGVELAVLALLVGAAVAVVYVPLKLFEGLEAFDEAREDG